MLENSLKLHASCCWCNIFMKKPNTALSTLTQKGFECCHRKNNVQIDKS